MKQQGFALFIAIFVLVILGTGGVYMLRLIAVQTNTANFAYQGARAYQAARAGIEWAVASISNGGNCSPVNAQSAMTFAGINGFVVTLNCNSQSYPEGSQTDVVYTITSLAQYDTYTASDYVARQIAISIVEAQ